MNEKPIPVNEQVDKKPTEDETSIDPNLPPEEVTIEMNFEEPQKKGDVNKKDMQFDFQKPPTVNAQGGVQEEITGVAYPNLPPVKIEMGNDFGKRTDSSQIDKKDMKFNFQGPPKVGVKGGVKEEITGVAYPNLPPETINVKNDFSKRPDQSKIDKKDMKFEFQGPPKVGVKGGVKEEITGVAYPNLPPVKIEMGNNFKKPSGVKVKKGVKEEITGVAYPNLPPETINVQQTFTKRPDQSKIDKKDMKFEFKGPPKVGVKGGVKEEITGVAYPNLPPETINVQQTFTKRTDSSQIDKKDMKFNFQKPSGVKVKGGVKEEITGVAYPNLPPETINVQQTFTKRTDQNKIDKKDMKFNFQGPPKVGVKGRPPGEGVTGDEPPNEGVTGEEPQEVKRIALDDYNIADVSPTKRNETLNKLLDNRKTADARMIQDGMKQVKPEENEIIRHQSTIQPTQKNPSEEESKKTKKKVRPGREFLENYWDSYVDSYHVQK